MKPGTRDLGPGIRKGFFLSWSRVPSPESRIYLITDRHQTGGRPLAAVVRDAVAGGVRGVQLREKDLPDDQLLALARELRMITADYGARLLINRRLDICQAVGADGVHLGADGLTVEEARRIGADDLIIGYSAHSLDEARAAQASGADFVTFGPVYDTPSKAPYGSPLGIERLAEACRSLSIPVFALGGVKSEHISQLLQAGAHGIALISAIIAAPDPAAAARLLLQKIDQHDAHS